MGVSKIMLKIRSFSLGLLFKVDCDLIEIREYEMSYNSVRKYQFNFEQFKIV